MLTEEMNERLTRVGPGTPMGELMRRYWQPFLAADQLHDVPVRPVRLLGEDLICYTDNSGTIGLVGNKCCHRGVGLKYGIPQEHGIRCMYHGWCYNEAGACTDMPFEPKTSRAKDRIQLKAYPVQEMGGLLFAYLGPLPAPILPPWELFVLPNSLRQIGYTVLPCNWLQCQENASDPVHTVYTHGYFGKYNHEVLGGIDMGYQHFYSPENVDGFSHVHSEMDEFGLQKACVYKKSLGAQKDIMHFHSSTMFPNYVRVGQRNGARHEYQIRVPIDDVTTLHFAYEAYFAPPEIRVQPQDIIPSYEVPLVDEAGNEILDHVLGQDYVAWMSQGPIADRTTENLGVTDSVVREYRDLLVQQIDVVESGKDPMNVFRNEAKMPDILRINPRICDWEALRGESVVIRGFGGQSDRFGRINDQIEALWEQISRSQTVETRV